MSTGISGPELMVLLVVAAVVLGPQRIQELTRQLATMVRGVRRLAVGAREQVRSELGPEFDRVNWAQYDPRQYDPRRIIREALADTIDQDDPLQMRSLPEDVRAAMAVPSAAVPKAASPVLWDPNAT